MEKPLEAVLFSAVGKQTDRYSFQNIHLWDVLGTLVRSLEASPQNLQDLKDNSCISYKNILYIILKGTVTNSLCN